MVNGDEAKYRSFFADSAYIVRNGDTPPKTANECIGKGLARWSGNFENLKVGDYKPAYPDPCIIFMLLMRQGKSP